LDGKYGFGVEMLVDSITCKDYEPHFCRWYHACGHVKAGKEHKTTWFSCLKYKQIHLTITTFSLIRSVVDGDTIVS